MTSRLLPGILLLLAGLCAGQAVAAKPTAEARFRALHEAEWQWRLDEFPLLAAGIGDPDAGRTLGAVDARAQERRLKHWQKVLRQLDRIPVDELGPAARVDAAVYRAQLEELVLGVTSRSYLLPMNSDSSFYGDLAFSLSALRFATPEEAEAYLDRLADVPRWFDDHVALLRAGLETGFTIQQVVLEGRAEPVAALAAQAPEATPYHAPFLELPAAWPAERKAALTARSLEIIRDAVQPAYRKLHAFLVDTYIPGARKTLAAEALPDGAAFYRAQIRIDPTLDGDPETIHATGLSEVARIRADMERVKAKTGFDGDLPAFFAFLRTDPQFYAKTPRELLERASYIAKRVDGMMPRWFGHLPRQPYGIAPVPDAIAPFYTTGRYAPGSLEARQSGTYLVNTSKLEARPMFVLPALTLHEAVPGHHLQGALTAEAGNLPPFRRHSYLSAYGEGWALYAEYLGQEMGVYETPYEEFGRLTYEMWRACRLVVDTGIHAKGWSRHQAIDYMAANTALSLHEITTEVDRYISWPAQALSYKLGEIEIRKLRAEAEQALGDTFDIRGFHDRILALGPVPLPVLRSEIEAWVKGQKT